MQRQWIITAICVVLASGCAGSEPTPRAAPQVGVASYYSMRSNSGKRTASGVPLNDKIPTAAHRTLPFGTVVRVTCVKTGKAIEVPITDRGPYVKGRIIDLSVAAARQIGIGPKEGIARVRIEVIKKP